MIAIRIQHGDSIDHTPDADVSAGDVIVRGTLVGVASSDIPAGTLGSIQLTGVFEGPKATGAGTDIDDGEILYWDIANEQLTTDDDEGANPQIGKAVGAWSTAAARATFRLTN